VDLRRSSLRRRGRDGSAASPAAPVLRDVE
jgi:hypothetical protein